MPKTAPAIVALILFASPALAQVPMAPPQLPPEPPAVPAPPLPPAQPRPEHLTAATMLAAPVGTPEITPTEDRWPAVRDAIHAAAVRWEIMDPREERHLLATREDFQNDLNLLRRRYQDLKDAPKLADCHRLPDRRTVSAVIQFNRDFRKNVESRLAWEPDLADLLFQVIEESDTCYQQWDLIRDAQCDFYHVSVRRKSLKWLRDSIGEEAFAEGRMPPTVPLWRFYTQ